MSTSDDRIEAHEASIARLIRANVDLRAEQKRMKWVALATIVLSTLAYFFINHTVAVFAFLVGGSAFVVGHYVVYMHIQENKLTMRSTKQVIASLRKDHRT